MQCTVLIDMALPLIWLVLYFYICSVLQGEKAKKVECAGCGIFSRIVAIHCCCATQDRHMSCKEALARCTPRCPERVRGCPTHSRARKMSTYIATTYKMTCALAAVVALELVYFDLRVLIDMLCGCVQTSIYSWKESIPNWNKYA
jgi:hypothetical protein